MQKWSAQASVRRYRKRKPTSDYSSSNGKTVVSENSGGDYYKAIVGLYGPNGTAFYGTAYLSTQLGLSCAVCCVSGIKGFFTANGEGYVWVMSHA
jgi:hypothetical protein